MQPEWVDTENSQRFDTICVELEGPGSVIGPSLGMVTSPAGRGKSEAAKHYATNTSAIYIPPLKKRGTLMMLQEITFELAKVRPGRFAGCLEVINDAMAAGRRLAAKTFQTGYCFRRSCRLWVSAGALYRGAFYKVQPAGEAQRFYLRCHRAAVGLFRLSRGHSFLRGDCNLRP